MRRRTRQNTINQIIGVSPVELLGPNPLRKAIVITPVAPSSISAPVLTKQSFDVGFGQSFVVPPGVTALVDAYVWGSGGDSGIDGVAFGGGGGGGGGFASVGPLAVSAGQIFTVNVDTHGQQQFSSIVSPTAVVLARANSGANGVLDIHGGGGTAPTGNVTETGGDGADSTALGGAGGGGAGGAGSFAVGGNAAGTVHGNGGGFNSLAGLGKGGDGGDGSPGGSPGNGGNTAGGGGGGNGNNVGTSVNGGNGKASFFWFPPPTGAGISMSHRQDVAVGVGSLNWTFDVIWPFIIDDEDIGDAIGLPWWIVSSSAGVSLQVTEYSYDCTPAELEDWINGN